MSRQASPTRSATRRAAAGSPSTKRRDVDDGHVHERHDAGTSLVAEAGGDGRRAERRRDRRRVARRRRADRVAGPCRGHAPALEHVAAVGDGEAQLGVLVDEQERASRVAQDGQLVEDLLDELRGEPERGLVEQQDARARHETAGEREHLLLASGEEPRARIGALAEARKALEHRLDVGGDVVVAAQERAEAQVVAHAQVGEDQAALRHQHEAGAHAIGRVERCHLGAEELNAAALGPEQAGQRGHQRRLAGAVGAEHRHHLAVAHVEIQARQHGRAAVAGDESGHVQRDAHGRRPTPARGRARPLSRSPR